MDTPQDEPRTPETEDEQKPASVSGYSEEDLAELSEDERQGMLDADLVDDAVGEDDTIAQEEVNGFQRWKPGDPEEIEVDDDGNVVEKTDSDGDGDDDKAAAEPEKQGEEEVKPDPKTDETVEAAPEPKPAAPAPAAERKPDRTAEIESELTTLKTTRSELAQKFDDGDLTAKEYNDQLAEIDDKRDTLRDERSSINMRFELAKDTFQNVHVNEFLGANPQYAENDRAFMRLDTEVRRLQGERILKGGDQFDPALLKQAHENLVNDAQALLGTKPEPKPKPQTKPKETRPEAPPTLRTAPVAQIAGTDGGKFAELERLMQSDAEAYEDALAGMSQADREEWENR